MNNDFSLDKDLVSNKLPMFCVISNYQKIHMKYQLDQSEWQLKFHITLWKKI